MTEKRKATKKDSRVSGGCRSVGPAKDTSGVVGVFWHNPCTCQDFLQNKSRNKNVLVVEIPIKKGKIVMPEEWKQELV